MSHGDYMEMGPAKGNLELFMRSVFARHNLTDWTIRWIDWSDPGSCFHDLNVIEMPEWVLKKSLWVQKEYALHELAHAIGRNDEDNRGHGESFYRNYILLLQQFMLPATELPKPQE